MIDLRELTGRPVIVGAGLAGLSAALELAAREPVVVVSAAPLGQEAASGWAQGGVAVAVGQDDSPRLHAADTLAAGDGLCDPGTVERITAAGPQAVERLAAWGARFDRGPTGFKLGLEAAHSRRRIVHADGDGTGREILRAVVATARACARITLLEGIDARRLLLGANGAIAGVLAAGPDGAALTLRTARVVLATGGLGGLYAHTTNPRNALGRGIAMAARAGAELADMEFVQFHPTALDVGRDPMPLVSEAVRGEGAVLVNDLGDRFMAGLGRAELEPRDVVARAVWAQSRAGRRVFLDARTTIGARFPSSFPAIAAACQACGIDPVIQPIPVRPAAHYHMGGIAVDGRGRASVPGLWACGEVAATGLHGANRLASNSLLEATVCGAEVACDVALAPRDACRPEPQPLPPAASAAAVRSLVEQGAGVLREREGLCEVVDRLTPLAASAGSAADPALVAVFIARGALQREESRGGHARTDFPLPAAQARRTAQRIDQAASQTIADAA